ncbi:MAG: alpha/beta hydrolase family protein [Congregibacter sp.]
MGLSLILWIRRQRSATGSILCAALLMTVAIGSSLSVSAAQVEIVTATFSLDAPQGREVPVLASYPQSACDPCRLVVFSHGAFAAPERYRRLSDVWARAGFVVVAPMHVDSELNASRDEYDRAATMRTRFEDFALLATGPQLRTVLAERGVTLMEKIIATGHSYGALIAQVAGGASVGGGAIIPESLLQARERVLGVVALSPPGPFPGGVNKENWAQINLPMLVVTGTRDVLPGFVDDWQLHLVSFEAASLAPAYALVFDDADHYFNGAFGRTVDVLSESVAKSVETLNAHTIEFMRALSVGRKMSAERWLALAAPGVEPRVSSSAEELSETVNAR